MNQIILFIKDPVNAILPYVIIAIAIIGLVGISLAGNIINLLIGLAVGVINVWHWLLTRGVVKE